MLSLLHIENIAVIEQADITLGSGFHVLTGETGAGKSIVIDAISAILGERASRDMIRTGCDSALVTALFRGVPELDWFAQTQTPYDPDELQIARRIHADGRNSCRVNGRPVTVALLRQLGLQLIQIHGQHDSQQLFDEQTHLTLLDSFARNEADRASYAAAYEAMQAVRSELASLQMDEGEKLRRTETLQHQIDEITAARLQPGEEEQLLERRRLLQNAEKLTDCVQEASAALSGGDESLGAASLLTEAARALNRAGGVSPQLSALAARLDELMYNVQDAADELRDLRDGFEFSPEELEQLESRLDVIHRLKRKYGGSAADVLAYCSRAQEELDAMVFADERMARLASQLAQLEDKAHAAAQVLHESRQAAAQRLQGRMMDELAQLDMPRIRFECEFSPCPLGETGGDAVRFLMSANAGEALKPRSRIASGGELARIMLAMKNVLAENDHVQTLIFDEVDAGVSGRAAQKVAEKLADLARTRQVLCVTHLPQLAARADRHYLVSKHESGGRSFTSVENLDFAGRREELARIIGGAEITETTRRSAEEMLRGHGAG